ncbi:MAG: AMP-binding protein [Actinomycetota bacterium]|nr:AMP-binding protein [Actinomycetota bacterium]
MTGVADYTAGFEARAREVLVPAARSVPALADRLAAAGMDPDDLGSLASLRRLPILTKDDVLELQAKAPPFGGLLAPGTPIRRIFQSPGPLYEPEPDVPDHWRGAPALAAAGVTAADVVLNCFGYHLSPAGVMFEESCRVLGATVVPGGVGNMELQVRAARDVGATAYTGTPSYLKALLEKADDLEGSPLRFERAVVGAEPLPPSLRSWLGERVTAVRQMYGTAETGLLGYECEAISGWHVPDDALVEVCALDDGQPVPDGAEGQVVVTLFSPHYPLVRFGTGDLSAFDTGDCPCGRPTPRLVGWLGRSGEAVKVRGMFLHPRQVAQVMSQVPAVTAYRFLIDRIEHKDVLRCEVVPAAGAGDPAAAVKDAVRSGLRFDVEVTVVPHLEPDVPPVTDLRTWD